MKRSIFLLLVVTLITFPRTGTAQTRDTWRSVRTNNLFVIGNADADKLRQVAVWLEFFHSAFGRLVSHNVLDASVPTTVVVFRDDASFIPFKPLYRGRAANLAGFFQPGEDVNYIAMSLDPRDRDPYAVAFHEYVHLHLRDNVPRAPAWLSEGLAEFYGHLQFNGSEALLGVSLPYLSLLRSQELLPLSTLLSVDHNSPHYNEQDKSGMFYGESWALVHYLMLGGPNGQDQFKRFLQQVSRGDDVTKALQEAFGMTLDTLEKELRAYVSRGELPTLRLASIDPQSYGYTAIQRQSLSDGEANYYLGDLLLHIGRSEDAERYFKQAIAADPNLTSAYAALGQLSVNQKRYPEATKYLERATKSPQQYLVHYEYAWLLSREALTPSGRMAGGSADVVATIREQLSRVIKLAPKFAPAYYLYAAVDLARDERLDEALEMAQQAHRLEPSNALSTLLLAEVYARRGDAAQARELAEPLTRERDPKIREDAQAVLDGSTNTSSANRNNESSRAPVSRALIIEPVERTTTTRMLGGESSGGTSTIRDGQTIENSGSLPTIDEVLARYVEAMGGEKAIRAVTTRLTKGTVDVAGVSRGGSFETYQTAPNKAYTVIDAYPFGTIKTGYNGRIGWVWNTSGTVVARTAELAELERNSDFFLPVGLKRKYAKVTLAGTSQIGYRDVYVIDLQPASGSVERMFLDVKSYLPVRVNKVHVSGKAAVPVEIYLDDWRAVDGIQFPFTIIQTMPRVSMTFTTTEIRHNVTIDATLFDPPKK
jgi:tetratricopeptide (TPR) repeat protein